MTTEVIENGIDVKPKKSLLIAIDFDGTIVEHAFPLIGSPLPGAFETMKDLQAAGHKLILNTCREDAEYDWRAKRYEPGRPCDGYDINRRFLTEAVEFCRENGIEFRSVNENCPDDEFRDKGGRKVYAHLYIDDRNLGGFPGWDVVRKLLLG